MAQLWVQEPQMSVLEGFFNVEDKCDDRLEELNKELHDAKKAKDKGEIAKIKADMNKYANERKKRHVRLLKAENG
ncbi:MAG: hypothetical protein ACLTSM_05080 [Eubacterium sp.]